MGQTDLTLWPDGTHVSLGAGRLKMLCRILEKLSTVGFYPTVITVWRSSEGGWLVGVALEGVVVV